MADLDTNPVQLCASLSSECVVDRVEQANQSDLLSKYGVKLAHNYY